MGCDIHTHVEVRGADGKWHLNRDPVFPMKRWTGPDTPPADDVTNEIFDNRCYSLFGWLADVRNYSEVPPLDQPRGLPKDVSEGVGALAEEWRGDGHSHSYFTAEELLAVDYEKVVEDRRYTQEVAPNLFNGAATCEPGKGEMKTLREHIGKHHVAQIEALCKLGDPKDVRVVFWFDN